MMSVNASTSDFPSGNAEVRIIADSGSTKTHWCVVHNGNVVKEFLSDGINPFYQTEEEIIAGMKVIFPAELAELRVKEICFYGAGCSFSDKKAIVERSLLHYFPDTTVAIESDLLAAARSLFQHEKGIACILGTGSNSCYYDGNEIVQNVSPLGFILGDEGSGAVLGKLFVADCLKDQLPVQLKEKFLHRYNMTPAFILDAVYKKPFPNRFLAQFCPFLLEHIEEPSIFNLVFDSFDAFFVRNVLQYPIDDLQVGFVGSIASCFRDTLEIVASERRIAISTIVQSPMEGLVNYHSSGI